jgi:flagella basal body P-ring formation protein FlgA
MTDKIVKFLPNATKIVIAIAIMVISMASFIASINKANASAIAPNHNVTVMGDHITLSDIFPSVETKRDYVLAPAPRPDVVLTWDAKTLNRIAKAFDIAWRASPSDQSKIRRLATIITSDMIEGAIINSLDGQITNNAMDLEFLGAEAMIILPHDMAPDITVVDSSYNPSRNTFSASIKTADNHVRRFTGVSHDLVSVPVLKMSVRRGDTIKRSMIEMVDMRKDYLEDTTALRIDELVGMTPRQIIRAGQPVAMNELNKPVMVKRGDLVTMQLRNGSITVTALAKAMESGTRGDMIRLVNVDSKRTLEAQVTGLREATVYN